MLGKNKNGTNNVPAEINKIIQKPILIITGEAETDDLNHAALQIDNYKKITIPGGHHYDKDPSVAVDSILNNLH